MPQSCLSRIYYESLLSILRGYSSPYFNIFLMPYFSGNSTQPSSMIAILFSHDNLSAWSNILRLVSFSPPKLGSVSKISFLNFGGLLPHMKFLNRFSKSSIISFEGDGRDNRTWIILEINKLLTIVIFPNGVRNLAFHIAMSFWISIFFKLIFRSVMSSNLSILYVIPNDTNSCVQSKFRSLHSIALLSPHTPTSVQSP